MGNFPVRGVSLAVLLVVAAAPVEAPRHTRSRRDRVMIVSASAYCQHGLTATGNRAQRGIVAADPRVFPIGTRLRIAGQRGVYRVMDHGASVKGRRIDIFMPACRDARLFGRRRLQVTVLGDDSRLVTPD